MEDQAEKYKIKRIALERAKDLKNRFEYVVVIKDRIGFYWIHTRPQDLCGDKLVLELA